MGQIAKKILVDIVLGSVVGFAVGEGLYVLRKKVFRKSEVADTLQVEINGIRYNLKKVEDEKLTRAMLEKLKSESEE